MSQSGVMEQGGVDGKHGKVVFQSRFRALRKGLKLEKIGEGEKGRGVYKNVTAKFQNFLLILDDNKDNAEMIELLRKQQGSDYQEINLAKKHADAKERDAEIAGLNARIRELEALQDNTKPKVKVRRAVASS